MSGENDFPVSETSLYERDLYVGITVAWYQMQPHGLSADHVLRPYVLGTGFASSVKDAPTRVDLEHVTATCALILCSNPWELDGLRKILDTQSISRPPRHELDPVCAWWLPLDRPSILGVHYWELGNGIVELRRLSRFEKPPALHFGRFSAERTEREAAAIGRQQGGVHEPAR
jgi:hypothetical protein